MAIPQARPSSSVTWTDGQAVPEELVGRLYRASENAILDLTATFTPRQRADLAAFCYHRSHMHGIGLAIAATCDEETLTQALGTALGQTMFSQSRERQVTPPRAVSTSRSKVTLAKSAGMVFPSPSIVPDDEPLDETPTDPTPTDPTPTDPT